MNNDQVDEGEGVSEAQSSNVVVRHKEAKGEK